MKIIIILNLLLVTVHCLNVETKLDFLESKPKVSQHIFSRPAIESRSHKDDFNEIGVVCTSDGCNKTKTDDAKVEVSIQTNVEIAPKQNQTEKPETIEDVPIVVGVAGTMATHRPIVIQPDNAVNFNMIQEKSFPREYRPAVSIPQVPQSRKYNYNIGFSNHYFGENEPQYPVWYPRRNSYNPVEYRGGWYHRQIANDAWQPRKQARSEPPVTTCLCAKGKSGNWIATAPVFHDSRSVLDPGTQINNKMAALN